jgi:hypothetical protein
LVVLQAASIVVERPQNQPRKSSRPQVWNVAYGSKDIELDKDLSLNNLFSNLEEFYSELTSGKVILEQLAQLKKNVREGDILVIADNRGLGYYYVYSKKGQLRVKQTEEEFGEFLPEEALPILKKYQIESYGDIEDSWGTNIFGIIIAGKPYEFVSSPDEQKFGEEYPAFRLKEHPIK